MGRIVAVLIAVAVPVVLRWMYSRSAARRAVISSDSIIFPESRIVPFIRWGGFALFAAGAAASWVYGRSIIATCIFGGLSVFTAVFARVDAIVINNEGISGASPWGRRVSLLWGEVAALECNIGQGTMMVIATNGGRICHSGFHLDRVRFEQEVKRRTGLPMKVIQPGTWKAKIFYR
jgi:hypothetical protein